MSAFKTDGTFTTATLHGNYRRSFPIAGDTTAQIIEQDFMILGSSFSPLALNTPHATVTSAYLVEEAPSFDVGGGILQWTRRYATVPATRSDYESFSYRFPGYLGSLTPPYSQYYGDDPIGRDPTVLVVPSRLEYKYALCATGETYTTPALFYAAQGVPAQQWAVNTNPDARVDYLFDGSPSESDPTLTAYQALVAAGTEIVAEDSKINRYLGNIYEIVTRYVVAH